MAIRTPLRPASVPAPNTCMDIGWLERQVLPPRCTLCGDRSTTRDLCAPCRADLPWIRDACASCGAPLGPRTGAPCCGPCMYHPPPFEHAIIPFEYAFPVDRLLLDLKFAGGQAAGRSLGELLADAVRARLDEVPALIVPVPLHPARLRSRGYNQAEELARPVSRATGIPLCADACTRVRDTPAQSTLGGRRRHSNVKGAFTCDGSVAGLHVAVIDDIFTTGSTVSAVATAVRDAGAAGVHAWCVARTVIPR